MTAVPFALTNSGELLADSMARFTLSLKAVGASPRKMSGVYSDPHVAGTLVPEA